MCTVFATCNAQKAHATAAMYYRLTLHCLKAGHTWDGRVKLRIRVTVCRSRETSWVRRLNTEPELRNAIIVKRRRRTVLDIERQSNEIILGLSQEMAIAQEDTAPALRAHNMTSTGRSRP